MQQQNRKYPRVFFKGIQETDKIIGIEAELENGMRLRVLDISYVGAAILKSSKDALNFEKGKKINVKFYIEDQKKPQEVMAEVIREDQKMIAVHFPDMSAETRLCLQKFLKEKLIGLNMHLVNPDFYIKEQKFDYWFHGPNETNVFIWKNTDGIEKATIEINYQVLTFDNQGLYLSQTKEHLAAPTEDYAYQVNIPNEKIAVSSKDPFYKQVLSLLSQISDETGVIAELSEKLLSAK